MSHTIAITGSTDGIGLETAKKFAELGHNVILHGRNLTKLEAATQEVNAVRDGAVAASLSADLSDLNQVQDLGAQLATLGVDVLINNAGVLKTPSTTTGSGVDIRFVVNTIAPYLLTMKLLPSLTPSSRIINLSSAAQSPVDLEALCGASQLGDMAAYAQSKLALTMWTNHLAAHWGDSGPVILSVNPGSLLGTKMVKEGFGTTGKDIGIGVEALRKTALDAEFADKSGCYYDQDAGRINNPHPDALDPVKNEAVAGAVEKMLVEQGFALS